MKKIFLLISFFALCFIANAQNVGIGTATPNANAALDIVSSNKGILMPRLSKATRAGMTNVSKGMIVYDTTYSCFYYHDGNKWLPINQVNNDSTLHSSYSTYPTVASMSYQSATSTYGLYGTLYDNGGPAGNYSNNSFDDYYIYTNDDSTVLIKVDVAEMNLESPYDSLEIFSNTTEDYYLHKQLFTGNRTGVFYFRGDIPLHFRFQSNGVNNLSGFKINWTKISTNSQTGDTPPLTGWYFNSKKMAARAGININNSWATDSLGLYSFAYGLNAKASGNNSFSFGHTTSASGDLSTAIGESTIASGLGSTAIGQQTSASGNFSTALGTYTNAKGYASTAMGYNTKTDGNYTTAMGYATIAKWNHTTLVGLYNDTTVTNSLFEVGNGSGDAYRSNAFSVDTQGGIKTKYSGSVIASVPTGTNYVNLTIPSLPSGWSFTNTLVLVTVADGITGTINQAKLTSITNIQLNFSTNTAGPARFNYIIFKL